MHPARQGSVADLCGLSSQQIHYIVTEGFELRERNIQVCADNPFSTGIGNPNENVLKVTVKGVPLSVEEICLNNSTSHCVCDIKYEKIRNPTTHRITEILNGNRFLCIKPLKEGEYLPRTYTCAGITCSLYHKGQPSLKRTPKCTKCWSTDHFTYQCEGDKCCKGCKKPGHLPGEKHMNTSQRRVQP